MKPRIVWFLLLFAFSFLPSSSGWPASIWIDSNEQFQFAREQMQKGEYERAVGEFERFLHFFPTDERVPEAKYLIGLSHLMAGGFDKAREVLMSLRNEYPDTPISHRSLFLIGETYYRQGAFEVAERHFQMVVTQADDPVAVDAALYRLGWAQLYQDRWRDASGTFAAVTQDSPLFDSSQKLAERSLEGETLPWKDPATAGVLAGMVPGLGHAYCERYRDGLIAFLVNGLFIWAAIEAFDEDVDVLGGILLFMELGWYTGNIYSAVNSAHKYNKRARDQYRKGLKDMLDISLLVSRHGHVGLAFRVSY